MVKVLRNDTISTEIKDRLTKILKLCVSVLTDLSHAYKNNNLVQIVSQEHDSK